MRNLTCDDDLNEQRNQHWDIHADIKAQESPSQKYGDSKMEHAPDVHIKNEPKFVDHAHPCHYPMYGGGGCNDGFLGGGGGIGGGLLLGALLGGGLGGFGRHHGNDGNCERAVFDASILSKLGTIEGQVPLVGSQTQTAVATSTGVINTNALQIALSSQQQLSAVAFATQAQLAGVRCGPDRNLCNRNCLA